jgi:hypothetical protein
MKLFIENRAAFVFIVKFVILYLAANTLYGFWIEWYSPAADPMTVQVAKMTAKGIGWFDGDVKTIEMANSKSVVIRNAEGIVIEVFEGCNGINVMLVFCRSPLRSAARWRRPQSLQQSDALSFTCSICYAWVCFIL